MISPAQFLTFCESLPAAQADKVGEVIDRGFGVTSADRVAEGSIRVAFQDVNRPLVAMALTINRAGEITFNEGIAR